MLVKVTQAHIDEARRRLSGNIYLRPSSAENCPLALSLRETTGDPWSVGCATAYLSSVWSDKSQTLMLTCRAMTFITRFDKGQPVEPHTFRL